MTLINIYGLKFWAYLIPAVLMKRPGIAEWQPLPVFANDIFNRFRVFFSWSSWLLISAGGGWRKKTGPVS